MKLIKAIEVTSRCRRRDGWWVGEGEMLRGLRELSCLDLQKNVFAFFSSSPELSSDAFAAQQQRAKARRKRKKKRRKPNND